MKKNFLSALLLPFIFIFITAAATNAFPIQTKDADSTPGNITTTDSIVKEQQSAFTGIKSFLSDQNKTEFNDIQQYNPAKRNAGIFVLLVALLAAITYLKTAFSNDLDALIQSLINRNMAHQIFRTQSREISFSSFVLNLNFIVTISLYAQFVLVKYYHAAELRNFSAILFIVFLFTFFYLVKIAALKFIGTMFEVRDDCDEYIFNFTTACKILGLALLPALFIFYTAPENICTVIFIITILIAVLLVAFFVWRGLSTGYKLLYRSVYHFFIYVCVVEISPIFLLFKLLTKTII